MEIMYLFVSRHTLQLLYATQGHKNSCKEPSMCVPNCCMALSALQGSSRVMCTRRRWFTARLSACREMPELAASEMIAMF